MIYAVENGDYAVTDHVPRRLDAPENLVQSLRLLLTLPLWQRMASAMEKRDYEYLMALTFAVGAAEEVIPRLYREEGIAADVVVVDPPRKGCDARLLETILQIAPEKVVYVSCNPATLARDLAVLAAGGYHVREVQPVDQFPHTNHIENVCLLTREREI